MQQSFGIGEEALAALGAHETTGRPMTLLMLLQTSFELEQLTAHRAHEFHFAIVVYEHIRITSRTLTTALVLGHGRRIVDGL